MTSHSAIREAADRLLRRRDFGSLEEFLTRLRDEEGLSYEKISRKLSADTDGDINVSANTIRSWIADMEASLAS